MTEVYATEEFCTELQQKKRAGPNTARELSIHLHSPQLATIREADAFLGTLSMSHMPDNESLASRYYSRWSSLPIMLLCLPVPSYLEIS
jgi:hypothetical protein